MNRANAHRLLNAARDGADVSTRAIRRALVTTGDLEATYAPTQTVIAPPGPILAVPSFLNRSGRVMRDPT